MATIDKSTGIPPVEQHVFLLPPSSPPSSTESVVFSSFSGQLFGTIGPLQISKRRMQRYLVRPVPVAPTALIALAAYVDISLHYAPLPAPLFSHNISPLSPPFFLRTGHAVRLPFILRWPRSHAEFCLTLLSDSPEQLYFGSGAPNTYSVVPLFAPLGALRVPTERSRSLSLSSLLSSLARPCNCCSTVSRVIRTFALFLSIITMFAATRASALRQRSASRSNDDHHSANEKPRKLFQRHAHDPSISCHSLATSSTPPDDLPGPSLPTPTSHSTSAQSTPMTSPSTGYSSLFPGSISSATSESVPAESKRRSEFGVLIPGSYSPMPGSASSRSSHPYSQFTADPDTPASAPSVPRKYPSSQFSHRPFTAPHSPSVLAFSSSAENSQTERHTRSHSRLTVSLKNLLSRPAFPSPSRFSFNSTTTAPSESEASSISFYAPATAGKWPTTPRKLRPPDLEISGSVAPAIPSPARASNTPIDAHRRHASEAVTKIYNSRIGSGILPASQDCLDASIQNASLPPARGREPKTRNVLRRHPSGSAKLFKGRERGMSSPSLPYEGDPDRHRSPPKESTSSQVGVPFPLTPASAVAEAYKQQELHRDYVFTPPKLSIDERMSPRPSHDSGCDGNLLEHPPSPYHAVFGSSQHRRVYTGGTDDLWNTSGADQRDGTTSQAISPSQQPLGSDSGSRSITRKISNRWRKVKGGVSEESPSHGRGHSKGRSSMQEIRGGDRPGTRSTGRSIDGMQNASDGAWASSTGGHARSGSDAGEGGKLWRLMRRISTGGLRDRFQLDKAVPPVPAIPKELLGKANTSERNREVLPSSPLRDKNHIKRFTTPKDNAVPWSSVATSSSSPNSSDVASMQFFHKAHSSRSSVSSYGEAVALSHVPESALDRHIITPLEQLRLGGDHVECAAEQGAASVPVPRSPRRSTSVPAGLRTANSGDAENVGEHLLLSSPRRQTCSMDPSSCGSSRPSSTSASGSGCGSTRTSYQNQGLVNGRSRMADGIVSLSPPPRPQRDARRACDGSGSPDASVSSPVPSIIVCGRPAAIDRTPSAQSDVTARAESPEPIRPSRDRDASALVNTGTQITFRELGAPRRPPLSEREKADIWDDLLARSDKAGGTLHINGAAELLSDSMRFSMLSES